MASALTCSLIPFNVSATEIPSELPSISNIYAATEPIVTTNGALTIDDTTTTTTVTTDEFSIEKKQQLNKLQEKGDNLIGSFRRAEKVLLGEISKDLSRITMDEINIFIESSDSFDETMQKIENSQPYPDFEGGSGVTSVEYWMNESGSEKILVLLEQKQMFHVVCNEDGKLISCDDLSENPDLTVSIPEIMLLSTYNLYNDIDVATEPIAIITTTTSETMITTTTTATVTNIE